ncbi:MAG TPA: hypothetical protein VJZ05_00215 [Bacilli bacterium]|jgi:hypothetical protein|nr:hypothetical protein [Bacilli bacterium]MDD3389544.1 hypothetical protein [Bacilli bacterium]MDD4345154.1 hypothetical protein [Bacilli bacterium]MDD4521008.1 hypothetical protein [Bacilli bacterium]MDY0399754.1 hypothetical protein [Bacilli bacterium]
MVNIFLSILMMMSSLMLFTYQYRFNGIHRTFLLLNNGVIDQGIEFDVANEKAPIFVAQELEAAVNEYLFTYLAQYTGSYLISFYYYEPEAQTYCFNNCQGVQIHLIVNLSPLPAYDHYQNVVINSRYDT